MRILLRYNQCAKKRMNAKIWDVVVIGGGPAGMMAAGRSSTRGKRVLLLEKNPNLGKKLLITGGGRCNVTNNRPVVREMLAKYKKSGKFLFSVFTQFGVTETLGFFNERGMATKEENEGRIFPVSNSAQSVLDVLVEYMKEGGVTVRTNSKVSAITSAQSEGGLVIKLADKSEIYTKACVVAVGGTSRPDTGSSGEGFLWLETLGHNVVHNNFALAPLALKDAWAKKLGGVTLQNIKLSVYQDDKKFDSQKGKLLFTHFGISGPTVLNISKGVSELLEHGVEVTIMLDLFPTFDNATLKEKVQTLLTTESNKKLKNTLGAIIPSALVPGVLSLAKIDSETPCHSVKSEERRRLISILKAIPLYVKGIVGARAVVSSGGVALEEVDFKTMQSRIVPGLYLVGDTLNIDRPSGGYSLQLCWTTGYVAGDNC